MVRKSKKLRTEEQGVRQKALRDDARAEARPSRDDVARMFLWLWISETWRLQEKPRSRFDAMRDDVTDLLVKQGFESQVCGDEIERLFGEYKTDTPPFRIKRHLKANQPPDPAG